MKTVSTNLQTVIDGQYGHEPVLILEINGVYLSDRAYDSCTQAIINVGQITSKRTRLEKQVGQVTVTISTTSDKIRRILIEDSDIHQKKARLYLSYSSLAFADKLLLYEGRIASPIVYNDKDKIVDVTLLQYIESFEVGFSPEEGQLSFVSEDLIGRAWPLGFGSVEYGPTVPVRQNPTTQLQTVLSFVDQKLLWLRQEYLNMITLKAGELGFWLAITGSYTEPLASEALDQYVNSIKAVHAYEQDFNEQLDELDTAKKNLDKQPKKPALIRLVKDIEESLDAISQIIDSAAQSKVDIEDKVDKLRFIKDSKREAARDAVKAQRQLRSLIGSFYKIEKKICNQQRFQNANQRVLDSRQFDQNVDVDVLIRGLRFTVQFDGQKMTVISGPHAEIGQFDIDPWSEDDVPCSEYQEFNGIDLLRTDQKNLTGKYLLIKKVGDKDNERHILQVTKQEGRKVYVRLVPWNQNRFQQLKNLSLDSMINEITDPKTANPNAWNRPETQEYLDILDDIGYATKREKQTIARLVYMKPYDSITGLQLVTPGPREIFTLITPDIEFVEAASAYPPPTWFNDYVFPTEEVPTENDWRAVAGATVVKADETCDVRIVNILPSTIKGVFAYRKNSDGERYLSPVPQSYYTKYENYNLGTINVTALVFKIALKDIVGENWESEVYVSYESSVGPRMVDILKYLITTYTDLTVDTSSFNTVETLFADKYPLGFVLTDRPNATDEINRIAWESRCAVWSWNGVAYIKYLSKRPTSLRTIGDSDLIVRTYEESSTSTENLVTKLVATWRPNGLPVVNNKYSVVYRYNVNNYGVKEQSFDFHTLNNFTLVQKSATFWLIRLANTYRMATFELIPKHLDLELYDAFTLDTKYNNSTLVEVESVTFDPVGYSFVFTVREPIRLGESSEYQYYWPSDLDVSITWPPNGDPNAGGYGPGSGVTGSIPC